MKKLMTNLILMAAFSMVLLDCSNTNSYDPVSANLAKGSLDESSDFTVNSLGVFAGVLNLTPEQREQIQALLKKHRENFQALRNQVKDKESFISLRAQRKEMRQTIQNEIFAILTPEQCAKAEEIQAQLNRGEVPQELIDKRIAWLSAKLNLTAEQQEQIRALETQRLLLAAKNSSESSREFYQKRKEILKNTEEQMLNIVNAEQQATFLELKADRKNKMQQRFENFGASRTNLRAQRLTRALDLNETQQQQLQEILASVRSNMWGELNGNCNGRNREELRAAMTAKMRQVDEQIQNILNAEQLVKYTELKQQRRQRINDFHNHFKQ